MKLVVALFLVLILGLAWQVLELTNRTRNQDAKIGALESQVSQHLNATGQLDLTERCAAQAERTFLALGYRRDGTSTEPNQGLEGVTLENHYNDRLKKCFMLITQATYKTQFSEQRYLLDAFESRTYGDYFFTHLKTGGPSLYCRVSPLGEAERSCGSEGEFNTFVAQYMR
jgi:hypothetical protein